jgi:hypothetical protein
MFTEIWKKYLPVIVILLKRSAKGEQMLNLDQADFKRAAGGRKIKFSFDTLRLNDGRTEYNANLTPMAREFLQALQNSDMIKVLAKSQQFEFAMNSDFQLIIKNNTIPADAVPE